MDQSQNTATACKVATGRVVRLPVAAGARHQPRRWVVGTCTCPIVAKVSVAKLPDPGRLQTGLVYYVIVKCSCRSAVREGASIERLKGDCKVGVFAQSCSLQETQ